jgi:hypothetical protein
VSWALAEKLRARFPEVELFPRPGEEHHEEAPPAGSDRPSRPIAGSPRPGTRPPGGPPACP